MKNRSENKIADRILAAILSILMVLSLIPMSSVETAAATTEHPDAVTITVKDAEGNAISGASVAYVINSTTSNAVSDTATTDAYGCVEVLNSDAFVPDDNTTISATVSKDKYAPDATTLASTPVTAADQNFNVQLSANTIENITVTPTTANYDETEHDAAIVSGIQTGDTVFYKLGDAEWTDTMPKIKERAEYSLTVKVQRANCFDFEETVAPKIDYGILSTIIKITPYEGPYDGQEHAAFTIEGLKDSDTYSYALDGEDCGTTIPKIKEAKTYAIAVHVKRNNYKDYDDSDFQATINKAEIPGLSAEAYTKHVYDGTAKELVTVTGANPATDTVSYKHIKVQDGESNDEVQTRLKAAEWVEGIVPAETDAGEYALMVKVVRDANYKETEVEIQPARAVIAPASQDITFDNDAYKAEASSDTIKGAIPEAGKQYNFAATDEGQTASGTITYSIEVDKNIDDEADTDAESADKTASIDATTGELTVFKPGTIVVKATLSSNDANYAETTIQHELTVMREAASDGQLINFTNKTQSYVFGANEGTVAAQTVTNNTGRKRISVSYKIDSTQTALACDSKTGKITIKDYAALGRQLANASTGIIDVVVTAELGANKWLPKKENQEYADKDTYTITISCEPTPANAYTITPADADKPNADWYNTAIRVGASDAAVYEISKTPASFGTSVTFDDQGSDPRYVYLRNKATGAITNRILLQGVQIDTEKPTDVEIAYSKSVKDAILNKITFGYYNPDVTVTFTAKDATSGVDYFTWNYKQEAGTSSVNLAEASGTVTAVKQKDDATEEVYYSAEVTLPKDIAKELANDDLQLRGNLTVTATDKAALVSDTTSDDGRVIVVDTISPKETVSYGLAKTDDENNKSQSVSHTDKDGVVTTHHFYNNDVEVVFDLTEANFYAEDVKISVTKDGEVIEDWTKGNLTWTDWTNLKDKDTGAEIEDHYQAKLLLKDEGDYVVTMDYTDRSGNTQVDEMDTEKGPINYQSDLIIIDKTKPVIAFDFPEGYAQKDDQVATVTITEHNFRPSDINLGVDAKDINGVDVPQKESPNDLQWVLRNATWTNEANDVHKTTISKEFVDAIYKLTFHYDDLALNSADEVVTEEFIVDRMAPATDALKVTYSTPIMQTVLEAVTFGFYNPDVTVTFQAQDVTSGVKNFTYSYEKEKDASKVNVEEYADASLTAVQDKTDKSIYTASVTLPKEKAKQLRGSIAFTATDNCSNTSAKRTDTGNVLVVDTIAPTMTVEYNKSSRTVGSKMYYNHAATATFRINEANFYSNDVVVEVSKNGGVYTRVSPSWTDTDVDNHIGTYTIAAPANHQGDGDYVIRVSYTDRSKNKMTTYTSNMITIDTINPTISVSYANTAPVNTLGDAEGNTRSYFSGTQTATITVNEHNFASNEVNFMITAKDVAGNAMNADNYNTKSSWQNNGDKHTITVTYPGNANYIFDIAYTDLATNQAADYKEDYFTVDTAAPASLSVSYSTSILETVLEGISFGFYNAKATVTITAEDDVSGVHSFKYGYVNAPGVSGVNGEMIDQAIEEAGITFSNGNRTATTTFEIPRDALGEGTQFNGTVQFVATDRSNNESAQLTDGKRLVVDNIAPTSTVTYNDPVQMDGGISYYDKAVQATINMYEANFYAEDVVVAVTKDGADYPVSPSWSNDSTDIHIGTFTLPDDGDYFVAINYKDKSTNEMVAYTSDQLTVDTKIEAPVITINGEDGNGKAYKEDVVPAVQFEDKNYDSYTISLTKTRFDEKDADVTETYIGENVNTTISGGSGSFDTFTKVADTDGIYNMTVTMKDKAGHTAETTAKFTVNRFGSVYEYSDYLDSLVKDGGAYVQKLKNDLVITEYNADRLVNGSLDIQVSCDGKPLEKVDYTMTPQMNDQVDVGDSGWYQYQYTINKKNFESDGVYKVAVSSKDATGNTPENTNYEDKYILFRVDGTAPELDSVTGLEESIINAQDVAAGYTVYDAIGLASVKVYVDGKAVNTITDFSKDMNNYAGKFDLQESSAAQAVRLVIEDKAGNVTDTDSENFTSAYAFNRIVTISTNFFVRFYANKGLFWGSTGGVAVALAGAGTVIGLKRRKKNAAEAEESGEE